MKMEITSCICCDHEPTAADSVYYGMPYLQLSSPYYAVKDWNEMQEQLKKSKEWGSLFE